MSVTGVTTLCVKNDCLHLVHLCGRQLTAMVAKEVESLGAVLGYCAATGATRPAAAPNAIVNFCRSFYDAGGVGCTPTCRLLDGCRLSGVQGSQPQGHPRHPDGDDGAIEFTRTYSV